MPDKILVVDDEVEIADLIEVYLNNEIIACLNSILQKKPSIVSTQQILTLRSWTSCYRI